MATDFLNDASHYLCYVDAGTLLECDDVADLVDELAQLRGLLLSFLLLNDFMGLLLVLQLDLVLDLDGSQVVRRDAVQVVLGIGLLRGVLEALIEVLLQLRMEFRGQSLVLLNTLVDLSLHVVFLDELVDRLALVQFWLLLQLCELDVAEESLEIEVCWPLLSDVDAIWVFLSGHAVGSVLGQALLQQLLSENIAALMHDET